MYDWLVEHKIPLGSWVKAFVDLLNEHAQVVFDFISLVIGAWIDGLTAILVAVPPLLLIAIFAGLAYALHRSISLAVFAALALLLVVNLGYWEATLETLSLVICSTMICVIIGLPLGIAAAHRPWLYALPAPIRLTHLGISSVPVQLYEAGKAFGATKHQLLFKVELPHALPTIMAGITQCIMLSLSMVVIAALVGADGLGKPVVRALNTVNISMGFEAGAAIVVLAIVLDRVFKTPHRLERRT
jgi:glycine betaine/proline transport system permease protein